MAVWVSATSTRPIADRSSSLSPGAESPAGFVGVAISPAPSCLGPGPRCAAVYVLPGAPPGRTVLDHGVGGRKEHALVTIVPADEVRWRAAVTAHLDDHGFAVFITDVMPLDDQGVPH